MSRRARPIGGEAAESQRIGPGRIVLVVGPSGAGKDTLIAHARSACRDEHDVIFPRRVITRPSSMAEDHDTLSDRAFETAAAEGAFAVWWTAHGLKYAIPLSIDADIRAGRTVVCNVSRTVVASVRDRFAHVTVVLVTAPQPVLAARLATRSRDTDGNVADRVRRTIAIEDAAPPDAVVENTGSIEDGANKLLGLVLGRNLMIAR